MADVPKITTPIPSTDLTEETPARGQRGEYVTDQIRGHGKKAALSAALSKLAVEHDEATQALNAVLRAAGLPVQVSIGDEPRSSAAYAAAVRTDVDAEGARNGLEMVIHDIAPDPDHPDAPLSDVYRAELRGDDDEPYWAGPLVSGPWIDALVAPAEPDAPDTPDTPVTDPDSPTPEPEPAPEYARLWTRYVGEPTIATDGSDHVQTGLLSDGAETLDVPGDGTELFVTVGGETFVLFAEVTLDSGVRYVAMYDTPRPGYTDSQSVAGVRLDVDLSSPRPIVVDLQAAITTRFGETIRSVDAIQLRGTGRVTGGRLGSDAAPTDSQAPATGGGADLPDIGPPRLAPGAEGYGMAGSAAPTHSDIRVVTTLAESGPGSLADALGDGRTIISNVHGLTTVTSEIDVGRSDLVIALQTAPGEGMWFRTGSGTNKLFNIGGARRCRYEGFTAAPGDLGADGNIDPFRVEGGGAAQVVLFRHMHMLWGRDQLASIWFGSTDINFDLCLWGPTLGNRDSRGPLVGDSSTRVGFARSVLAGINQRAPRMKGGDSAFVNLLVSGWRGECMTVQNENLPANGNILGCTVESGPESSPSSFGEISLRTDSGGGAFRVHIDDNRGTLGNDESMVHVRGEGAYSSSDPDGYYRSGRVGAPFTFQALPRAQGRALAIAQAGPMPNRRNAKILRLLGEVNAGNARPDASVSGGGGWPTLSGGESLVDMSRADKTPAAFRSQYGIDDATDCRSALDARGVRLFEHYLAWCQQRAA